MSNRIPKQFRSLEEERRFWQTHDITDFWSELTPVKVTFVKARRTRTVRLTSLEVHTLHSLLAKLVDVQRLPAHSHHKS